MSVFELMFSSGIGVRNREKNPPCNTVCFYMLLLHIPLLIRMHHLQLLGSKKLMPWQSVTCTGDYKSAFLHASHYRFVNQIKLLTVKSSTALPSKFKQIALNFHYRGEKISKLIFSCTVQQNFKTFNQKVLSTIKMQISKLN